MLQAATFPVQMLRDAAGALAARNVFIGTSSWKYPGWAGLLYDEQRYLHHGKFAESRFKRHCLEEYASVFRTVCVDAGYYQFPSPDHVATLCSQVPDDFRFVTKVTDEITARTFPNLPRHGSKAGKPNPHFLDADLFRTAFLASWEKHRSKLGLMIFEFSHFHPRDFERGREFVERLDTFLSHLPTGWQYGVEVRNKSLLHPDYLAVLARHRVAHVMNNWTRMPTVAEQWQIPGILTTDFTAARFLLRPGRTFEQGVELFQPYNATKEPYEEARTAAAAIIEHVIEKMTPQSSRPSFLFANNRLEGNALFTLLAVITALQRTGAWEKLALPPL